MNAIVERTAQAPQTWDDRPAPALQVLTPMDMLNKAVSQGAGLDVLERLMALQERWEANQARRAFDEAMSSAKAEIPTIAKNRHVGFESRKQGGAKTDYRHEDLAEIARTIDPILGKHGLSYRFRTTSEVNQPVVVTCKISHRDGHFEENTLTAARDESGNKNSIQAIGSTVTYLQRYTLKAALGLAASNDDDGTKSGVAPDVITDDQCQALLDRMREVNADFPRFLTYFKIEELPELPAARFDEAMTTLNRRGGKS